MATAADLHRSPNGNGRHGIPSSVLLSLWCPTATRFTNATTATSTTSSGVPISVTFCSAARPPAVSHLSVDCPGLELDRADLSLAPKVLGTDADLALLRVPNSPYARYDACLSDYFVYRVHSQLPKLDRLPSPNLELFGFGDNRIAILSCGDGKYVVAALEPLFEVAFKLYLYRSGSDGMAAGRWTSQRVVVENPLRNVVCPLPDSARRVIFHLTSKVIVLGGARGTIGWVDLWRGILLCDVLEDSPKLRDMPLPLPSMDNWSVFRDSCLCPLYNHDIVVNQSKDTVKYVEMERTDQWSWETTIWTMPIPVTSWDDWQRQCSVRSEDIDPPADIRMHFRLLHRFHRDKKEGIAAIERTVPLGALHMACPALSIADDDDVVYLLCEGINAGLMKMVFAVDVRTRTLRGMVKHDAKRRIGFFPCYFDSGISKHLKTLADNIGDFSLFVSHYNSFSFLAKDHPNL
ncbi:unnamed protein product [Urochloa decumbens]|uniref:DUF1618 domain-containing protein n=1 Tax=Urochloa decumbens TaxID=240449 RepID=A0ABC8Z1A1_9POAL